MKKAYTITFILLVITLGLLIYIKKQNGYFDQSESDEKNYVEVTFLDIGQGDATFIEWPSGVQMLVDCSKDARVLEALGRVMEFYDKTINYLVITHPDLDHYGGCTDVMKRFEIENIVYTGVKKDYDDTWQVFWQTIQDEGAEYVQIDAEKKLLIASTTFHFIYPNHDVSIDQKIPGIEKELSSNNTSIVSKLSFGDTDLLLMADAESELEEYLMDVYGRALDVEILKAGHHGSSGSSILEFVSTTSPEFTIFSAGAGNSYGHPSRRIIKRFERASSTIWRTDVHGDIVVRIFSHGAVVVR